MSGPQAWVTLATNDSYAMGALVLARSLRRVNTSRQLVVMTTPGVSGPMREVLNSVYDIINEVNILDSEDAAHLALMERPELGVTFTKIHCWKLVQFSKCVFLDADTLVIQNCDELFDREELSAAPDAGWPDCFNSGVFVFRPSLETYTQINTFAKAHGSFDGGDQGLLNMYFNQWSQADASRRLPFIYNMCASATYSYLPAFKVFGQNVKIVHFIGQDNKPWLAYFDTATGQVRPQGGQDHLQELLQAWWNIFRSEVHPRLSPEMGGGDNQSATMVEQKGIAGIYAKMSLESGKSEAQIEYEDHMRKMAWEQGHIDYMGKDSFDNIMKRIQASMAETSIHKPTSPPKRTQSSPKQDAPTQPPPQPEAPKEQQPTPPVATEQAPPKVEAPPPESPVVVETPKPEVSATPQTIPSEQKPNLEKEPAQATPLVTTAPPLVIEPTVAASKVEVETQAASVPPPQTPESGASEQASAAVLEEDRKALEERQAVERKLAEQKKVAEQKLEEEMKVAAAKAVAAAAAATSAASAQATATPTAPPAKTVEPKAPPRKVNSQKESQSQSGLGNTVQYGVGLGLLGAAVVLVFAIYATYSPTSFFHSA